MDAAWRNRYEAGMAAAREAGQLALEYFDREIQVQWKSDHSPVTIADQNAEKRLRETLLRHFPSDGFLGEEFGDQPGTSGYRWIIDPIDGTRSFVRGVPLWATLVGLEYKGELIAGITYAPALGQTWHALRGAGAWRDERRIHVSDVDQTARAHLYYSSINWFRKAGKERPFLDAYALTERQRGFGDFYGFVLVAQGSGEVMIEHGVHSWDLASLIPLVEEAGGKMTNWQGRVDLESPDVLATNGRLHAAFLEALT